MQYVKRHLRICPKFVPLEGDQTWGKFLNVVWHTA